MEKSNYSSITWHSILFVGALIGVNILGIAVAAYVLLTRTNGFMRKR